MKFMRLQNYGGVDESIPPMSSWTPEEIEAHIAYQHDLNDELTERGEFVEGQALTAPEQAKFVVSDGVAVPVVTDGPFPESKELLAGYRIVDVDSLDRAIEIAAKGSAAPQVLAAVVRRFGDFADSEDAVQEAMLAAATQWPLQGTRVSAGRDRPAGACVRSRQQRLHHLGHDRADSQPARQRQQLAWLRVTTLQVAAQR